MKLKFNKENAIVALLVIIAVVSGIIGAVLPQNVISTSKDVQAGVKLPIIMYHSVLKSAKNKTKYIVTPEQLESDLKWIQSNGYTPVFMSDVIDYVYNGSPLPEKPIVITFDDGYYNNLTYLYPLLVKYDMKAVISVVGEFSENFSKTKDLNPSYAHLTWDNIKKLSESGLVEIQNHTYSLHTISERKGAGIIKGESVADYSKIFCGDITKLQDVLKTNCNVTPNTFTYPYGNICEESKQLVKDMGFKASLSCYEKLNYITDDKNCLYCLGRFNRDSTLSTEAFMSKIK